MNTTNTKRGCTSRSLSLLATAAALAVLSACSSMPETNLALDQARARHNAAAGEPQLAALAPEEWQRAGAALNRAQLAWREGADPAEVDHLAYLSSQQLVLARETASGRASEAVTARAGAERDRLRLSQRTDEADRAKRQLAASEQGSARKSEQLAVAGAMTAQARAEAGDAAQAAAREQARSQELEQQLRDINARQTPRGMVVTLGDVLFDSGRAQLQPEGTRHMSKLAEFFKKNPERSALIEGYTDSVGSPASNQQLSERRAQAVMAALVGMGVAPGRLNTRAFGEDQPVAGNDNAAGRQMNRRVEIVLSAAAAEVSRN